MADPATSALSASLSGWRANYWDRPLVREACVAMAAKYAALASLEALAPGSEQDAALRDAAGRWPGCLRESQLAGPTRCRERHAQASAGALGPERRRASWRDEGAAALVLWADLHPLLGDLLAWRRASGGQGGLAGLVAFTAKESPAGRWPDPALLAAAAGTRVRVRMAYAWLAAQADLGLPALNLHLFGRAGPWDARTGDPSEIS